MTARIAFIDTSVLCNLVPVPGWDQDRDRVHAEYKTRKDENQQFILPITAVIETGNFIAQVPDGRVRRRTADAFDKLLRLIQSRKSPWVLHDVAWNADFIGLLLDGAATGISYVDHAQAKVGAGDLTILTEREQYRSRSGLDADVWTLDSALAAHG